MLLEKQSQQICRRSTQNANRGADKIYSGMQVHAVYEQGRRRRAKKCNTLHDCLTHLLFKGSRRMAGIGVHVGVLIRDEVAWNGIEICRQSGDVWEKAGGSPVGLAMQVWRAELHFTSSVLPPS